MRTNTISTKDGKHIDTLTKAEKTAIMAEFEELWQESDQLTHGDGTKYLYTNEGGITMRFNIDEFSPRKLVGFAEITAQIQGFGTMQEIFMLSKHDWLGVMRDTEWD